MFCITGYRTYFVPIFVMANELECFVQSMPLVGKLGCFLFPYHHNLRLTKLLRFIIGLHHPLDGVTNPKYKLLCFIQLTIFLQREECTSF